MATPTTVRFLEAQLRTYRRTWRGSVVTTFLNPILFLAAMGLGVGALVDQGSGREILEGIAYVTYLAPGLLAATTMQTGAGDSSWPVMAGMKWQRTYEAALATPVDVASVVLGHFGFVFFRVLFTALVYAVVMAVMASVPLDGALLSVLPAVLTGMSFGTIVMAFTASRDGPEPLSSLYRFGIVPLFLFSGTFFPVAQLPDWLEPAAYATPLWHGVELTRAAALGLDTTVPAFISVLYLVVVAVAGAWLAIRNLDKRMVT
jgi:lipooligosaccharide transport system permease protein